MEKDVARVVVGASSGLGAALLNHFGSRERGWIGVSRPGQSEASPSEHDWIYADVATPEGCEAVANALRTKPIDCLIYSAGAWEDSDLSEVQTEDIFRIVNTNLSGFIALCARLRPELSMGSAVVLAIGSISGLENSSSPAAAYVGSKHGLRGATQSLREWFRGTGVRVSCLSLGSLTATEQEHSAGARIPHSDVILMVDLARRVSSASVLKELHVPAMADRSA